jgi:hypothetical protein
MFYFFVGSNSKRDFGLRSNTIGNRGQNSDFYIAILYSIHNSDASGSTGL